LSIDPDWKIITTKSDAGIEGYRFWPDKVKGEGFFIACLKKMEDGDEVRVEIKIKKKFEMVSKKEMEIVKYWVKESDHEFVKVQNAVYAVPKKLLSDFNFMSNNLHIIYFGTLIGEIVREKLIPAHALSMSHLTSENIGRVELNIEQAIRYLQKKDLREVSTGKRWNLVTYRNSPLGWINVLPNRINNYYPKELRILKDI
jgi:NOL1/NOP2/fmu family ribosome biogenesis protein